MPDRCLTQWCHHLPTSTGCASPSVAYHGICLFIAMPHLWVTTILQSKVLLFTCHFSFLVYCTILQWFLRKFVSNFPESETAPFCAATKASFSVISLFTVQFLHWSSCFLILLINSHVALSQMFFDFFIQGKSHGYNIFIKERYQASWHALPLINLCCCFLVCFLSTSMSLIVPCFQTDSKILVQLQFLLFSCLYHFPCFFSSMTTLFSNSYRIHLWNCYCECNFTLLAFGVAGQWFSSLPKRSTLIPLCSLLPHI